MDEIVERLRSLWPTGCGDEPAVAKLMDEAADRIEALEARCERYREALARIASGIDGQAAYDGKSAQIIARAALEEAGNGRG